MKNKKYYEEPINEIIEKIDNSSNNVLLAGSNGSGKSTILNIYENRDNNSNLVVNGTIKYGEFYFIPDDKLFNLYHTCLICQKIILAIRNNYPEYYMNYALHYNYIKNLLDEILLINQIKDYDVTKYNIDRLVYDNPVKLIDNILENIYRDFDYDKISFLVDNFDVMGSSSSRYQKYIYESLKNKLKLVLTVSDIDTLNKRRSELAKDATIIDINYNRDIESIKKLLNIFIVKEELIEFKDYFQKRIDLILGDNIILEMIDKTKGNIYDMMRAIRVLYDNITFIKIDEYGHFLINYLDKEINPHHLLRSKVDNKSQLHI